MSVYIPGTFSTQAQHPVPVGGDSIYQVDVLPERSVTANWVDVDGAGLDPSVIPFTSLSTRISNESLDNPKVLEIRFHRTINAHQVALGCEGGGDFSNVRVTSIGSGGEERVVVDEQTNDQKRISFNYEFAPLLFNGVRIEFFTTDPVCISNCAIQKSDVTSAQLRGIRPDEVLTTIGATRRDNLRVSIQEYGDTPAVDAFARQRVSEPFTIFDSKQLHDKQPLFWDERLGGAATSVHNDEDSNVIMTVTASASDYVIRQTKQRFNYQPGKSQLVFATFRASVEAGVAKRVGVFDGTGADFLTPHNGIFFRCSGSGLSWNICKDGVLTETVTQAQWNVDALDGNGVSGITFDPDSTQILVIDYEWLGVGRVRVGFVVDGLIYYVHKFNHANAGFTSVYTSTPNLPVRFDVQSDGAGGGAFSHICSTVMSEGGVEETGVLGSVDTGSTALGASVAGTIYAVKGIRLKDVYKDITVLPEYFSMINAASDDFRWSLCLNPVISGTFAYTDVPNSAIQEATGVTANVVTDEGLRIDSGYTIAGIGGAGGTVARKIETTLRLGSTIEGVQDEIVLCVMPLSAGSSIHGALTYRELL